jgi:hypothetical protein
MSPVFATMLFGIVTILEEASNFGDEMMNGCASADPANTRLRNSFNRSLRSAPCR